MSDTPESDAPEPGDDPQINEVFEAEIVDDAPVLELPEDPAEAVPVLISELMAARAIAVEAADNWKRAVAEFENFRKRSIRDQDELIARSSERVVVQLLPVLDSLDALRRLSRVDPITVPDSAAMYSATAGPFSYGGISFAITRRFLAIAEELAEAGGLQELRLNYHFMNFLHHLLEGDWSEERAVHLS